MTYLQHVEVKPTEWRRIFQELAPQVKRPGAYEGNFLEVLTAGWLRHSPNCRHPDYCVGIDVAAAMAPQAKGKKAKRR